MPRRRRTPSPEKRLENVGSAPGQLQSLPGAVESRLDLIVYGSKSFDTLPDASTKTLKKALSGSETVWANFVGLKDVGFLTKIGDQLGLHQLALEDVVNSHQRAKHEDFELVQFVVARMPVSIKSLETEQLSLFLGRNFVFTVQEKPGDCFEKVRDRLREGRVRIRGGGPDYLAYALLDSLVDSYFPLLESIGIALDDLELAIMESPENEHVTRLHEIKRELVILRRYVEPLRDVIGRLLKEDNDLV
ncbi:MAG: magnesium and cobalt transport protein CorA, partial [Candidatus Eisenbacteria bacterium]|nr:magnesium and cobalt transport protein CorA [Candidatus Eisenbacteria bacterium]